MEVYLLKDNNWFESERKQIKARLNEVKRKQDETRYNNAKANGLEPYHINRDLHETHDSIYTIDNDSATLLYIIVMLGGLIFQDRLVIWIGATIVYFLHLTRHNRKK